MSENKSKEYDSNIENIVIYHGGCPDGVCSAWSLSLAMDNNKTYYHGATFKEQHPNVENKVVIFVDFVYPKEQILQILKVAKSVLILDHHATSKKLESIDNPNFTLNLDMNRSGAQMAWDYAVEHLNRKLDDSHVPAKYGSVVPFEITMNYRTLVNSQLENNGRPWFIDDIADRDLWLWQIKDSKNTTRRMFSMGIYENINSFYQLFTMDRTNLVNEGIALNLDDERIYNSLVKRAITCTITTLDRQNSWKVRVVECDYSYASEVGNRLVLDGLCDFSMMYRYDLIKDEWWISCRALPTSSIDLTQILPLFDPTSGGHPKASGMTLIGSNSLRNLLSF